MNKDLIKIFAEVEEFHWWFVGRRLLLERYLKSYLRKEKSEIKILDIGCGSGGNLKFLTKFGRVYGIDNLDVAVDYCRQRGFKNVRLADARSLPFPNQTFDIVSFLDVIEHIKDDQLAIREAKRVLKTGGLIVITVPALPIIWSNYDKLQDHHRRYLPSELTTLAKNSKLQILTIQYFNFFLLMPIALVRILSKLKFFKKLGEHDSNLNFRLARIRPVNKMLLGIFGLEVFLNKWIKYPSGVSLLAVFKKIS